MYTTKTPKLKITIRILAIQNDIDPITTLKAVNTKKMQDCNHN